jgi:hypothetical protein
LCEPNSVALYVVAQALHAAAFGAWLAAKHIAVALQTMPNDPHAARVASRRQCMNGAFEAVKGVLFTAEFDQQRLVVVVPADFARSHASSTVDLSPIHGVPDRRELAGPPAQ